MTPLTSWLTALSLATWLACFGVLASAGTWLPFAFAGLLLGAVVVVSGAVPRDALRLDKRSLLGGAGAGVSMVIATHAAYRLSAWLVPSLVPATAKLMELLNVVGYPAWARTLLIATIASSEELIFRGLLPAWPSVPAPRGSRQRRIALVAALSVAYALAALPLQSGLLVGCALVCGLLWASLRLWTSSVIAPVLAHVLWDLGVLLLWPLPVAP